MRMHFKKAYGSVHRESRLVNTLEEFRFPNNVVNLVGANINQTGCQG